MLQRKEKCIPIANRFAGFDARQDPSSLGNRLGGEERAPGAYQYIREERERQSQQRRNPKGDGSRAYTLLELLLALLLAGILLAGAVRIYLGVTANYAHNNALARASEDLRMVAYILTGSINTAGYAGCGKIANLDLHNNLSQYQFSVENSVRGYTSSALPSRLSGYQIASGTDVLVVQKADKNSSAIIADVKIGDKNIQVLQNPAVSDNKILLISDCASADLFTATNFSGTTIKTKDSIAHSYKLASDAQVGRFTETAYFISTDTTAGNLGLYYAVNYGNKVPLIPNVSGMNIRYGVSSSGSGVVDKYLSADEITSAGWWGKVVSVVISLSEKIAGSKTQVWDVYVKLRER